MRQGDQRRAQKEALAVDPKELRAKQVIWGSAFEAAGKAAESPEQECAWPLRK